MVGCLTYGAIALVVAAIICVWLDIDVDSTGGTVVILLCLVLPVAIVLIKGWADESEKKAEQKERQRRENLIKQVEDIRKTYQTPSLPLTINAFPFPIDNTFLNNEIVLCVKEYKNKMRSTIERCKEISNKIKDILLCSGYSDIDAEYLYLQNNQNKLIELNRKFNECYNEMTQCKIKLLNEDNNILQDLKSTRIELSSSRICISDGIDVSDFLTKKIPTDLKLFEFTFAPVTVFLGEFYFCLFSNVVLVFDRNGVFSTAVDPTALKIEVNKLTTSVTVINGSPTENPYVSSDSKLLSLGSVSTRWQHTRNDGLPDMRYTHNPLTAYRTEIYEYAKIKISIADINNTFIVSSELAINAFENVKNKYIRKYNDRNNPIPDFLLLIKRLSDENVKIDELINEYDSLNQNNNYFCEISIK